jgi:hypothetical protein
VLEHTGVWMLKSERTLKDFNVSAFDDIGTLKKRRQYWRQ